MTSAYKIRIAASLREIDAAQWDRCANPEAYRPDKAASVQAAGGGASSMETCRASVESSPDAIVDSPERQGERFNPFITHAFLNALETSRCVGPSTGWTASHVLVEDPAGRLVAMAPTYVKTHSMGEYVFDYGWAEAYERAGLDYYPKLQVSVPFTPASGRRLLVSDAGGAAAQEALIAGLRAWRAKIGASSIHVTFPTQAEWEAMGQAGFLQRTGQQFHFLNKAYGDFEAFLSDLASRKRKMIRRERKDALANGIEIELLRGAEIKEAHWDAFFQFYIDTGSRKWGQPYLTRAFFSEVSGAMAQHILLIMAKRQNRYIAGAINFIGKDALYGRNWGCIEDHPFLHFEVCYYQAMEYAIRHGLARVEAGAQGEHKLARGYGAVATYSAHDIADRRFARAIDEFLARERVAVGDALDEYAEMAPFKKAPQA
jgi:predicted N-acyltransferase